MFKRGRRYYVSYYAPTPEGRTREHREVAGDSEQDARKLLRRRLRELAVHRAGLRQFSGPRQERVMMYEVLNGLERDYEIRERRSLPQLRSRLKRIRAFF